MGGSANYLFGRLSHEKAHRARKMKSEKSKGHKGQTRKKPILSRACPGFTIGRPSSLGSKSIDGAALFRASRRFFHAFFLRSVL
jgi:hypothetical protein